MIAAYASPLERVWYYAFRILCGLVLVFLMLPILVIAPLSFNADSFLLYPMSGFSLKWYEEFFTSPAWRQAFMNSCIVSPFATLLAMALGTPAAVGLTRIDFPGKALLTSILISPMVVPVVIVGVFASAIAAFFYVRVIVLMFFTDRAEDAPSVVVPSSLTAVAIGVAVAVTVILGVLPQSVLDLADKASTFIR